MNSEIRVGKKEKKEQYLLVLYFTLAFVVLLSMIIWVASAMIQSATLKMKSEAERSFNSVYMTLLENPTKTSVTMQEEKVYDFGIYTSTGKLVKSVGNAPSILPSNQFKQVGEYGGDSADGMYSYEKETQTLHYLRLTRMNFHLNPGDFFSDPQGKMEVPLDFPEVLYVSFDGSDFQRSLTRIRFLAMFFIIFVFFFFLAIARIYMKNQEYQKLISKQKSLVNLGAAARTLTHEIKNPLSALTIQIALMKKTCSSEYFEDLKVMENEVKRLILLTNKVSDFLKNPLGEPQKIEIRGFLENICSIFPYEIKFTPTSLDKAYISFDINRARSVFENLVKNATESCKDRDPQVTIHIERVKKIIKIKIMDRGDGLQKNVSKEMYFDPFFTTKIQGSGIGLAISKQFINARGGSIKLYSREGGGTVVQVLLSSIKG